MKNINDLYEQTLDTAQKIIHSSNIIPVIKIIFEMPVFRTKTIVNKTDISPASIRRYLAILEENKIIFSNGKQRNKTYYFYDLLDLIRG